MKKELQEVFEELKKTDPEGTKRRGKMAVDPAARCRTWRLWASATCPGFDPATALDR
jgi:hypothetical protein